jgi:hypothetical protein
MIQTICLALAVASVGANTSRFDETHWNTDASDDIFKFGTFTKADDQGWPDGWKDLTAFETGHGRLRARGRGTVTLGGDDDGGKVAISTTVDLPPNTEHVTFMVRLRGPNIERGNTETAGGGVTFSLIDAQGGRREFPRIDAKYVGYRDWQNRIHTARVLEGETKLHVSIALMDATGSLEVDNILIIPSNADDEATPEQSKLLTFALDNDDADAIAQLIKDDPRMLEMRTGRGDNGTPLCRAAWTNGSPKVAAKLIELGADIEVQDANWGNTPLRWSAWWGTHEVAAVLIKAGAKPLGASRMAQSAKTANRGAKRDAEDFNLVSKLVNEYEANLAEEAAKSAWSRFRGPNGSGVATRGKFPSQVDVEKNAIWKTPLPHGVSSPCIWGDRIFLTSFDKAAKKLETICVERESGDILWKRTAPAKQIEKVHQVSSPANATPATDGKRVYVYFCSYGLLCYDFEGGLLWKRELAPIRSRFGSGTSPIVFGPTVFLNRDGDRSEPSLLAIDGQTGEDLWQAERPRWGVGYTTPIVSQGERDELVLAAARRIVAYDTDSGKQNWSVNGIPSQTCASPVFGDGLVYVSATGPYGEPENYVELPPFKEFLAKHDANDDGVLESGEVPNDRVIVDRRTSTGAGNSSSNWFFRGLDANEDKVISQQEWENHTKQLTAMLNAKPRLLAVRSGGSGDVGKTHLDWNETRGVAEVPTPLLYKQRLYTVRNGGIVHCRDPKTGKELFRGRLGAVGGYYASPVAGDDKIYFASDRGDVTVISVGDKLNVIARSKIGQPIYATPALVNDTIYVRTDTNIYAFSDR